MAVGRGHCQNTPHVRCQGSGAQGRKSWWTRIGGKDTGWAFSTLAKPAQDATLTTVLSMNTQSQTLELPAVSTNQPCCKDFTSGVVEGMIHAYGWGQDRSLQCVVLSCQRTLRPGLTDTLACLGFLSCWNHPGDHLWLRTVLWFHGSRPRLCPQAHGPRWIVSYGHILFNAVSQNWLCRWLSQGLQEIFFPFEWGSILLTFEKLSYSVNKMSWLARENTLL